MQRIRALSGREHARLEKWLNIEGITLNPRSLRDTYSDVRPVAQILQKKYPSIKLEFYTSASSFARRLQNWQVFSFRDLKKLGLRLKASDLIQLAEGKPGAVDWLLFRLIFKEEEPPKFRISSKAISLGVLKSLEELNCCSHELDCLAAMTGAESSLTLDKDWKL
ncbi:uncharacterized protein [Drosophila pseudoobscura]|uniref:CH-like domain-containing protein n=1 Tax=Drosophila pseudoobscura pseudoobscura TaxID=46245 RepID=A0A6I8VHQ5_DROPS|nr:uncharacterized protein LOC26533665 [Drosophila pseudoobscura]XP_033240122.1 uncharacterized protein LOC26533665 [Drosophila pseudoobscura]